MLRAIAAIVLVTGCWRDAAPPAASPAPAAPPSSPPPLRAHWGPGHPGPDAEIRHTRSPNDIASALAIDLRRGGLTSMFVNGPIVELDLDTSVVSTQCGAPAFALAQRLDMLFWDPARSQVICRPSQMTYTCAQLSSQPIVIVELGNPPQWRIVSVIMGSGRPYLGARMAQFRNQIATATCP